MRGETMTIRVAEVVAITRSWAAEYGARLPGFQGAHLMGGLSTLPDDAPFPTYRDVDIAVVVDGADDEQPPIQQHYRGLMIEAGHYPPSRYQSATQVLADPALAPHLAAGRVLADPHSLLRALQLEVAHAYTQPEWVAARCGAAKRQALALLAELDSAESFDAYLPTLVLLVVEPLCGLPALACLRPPTHRRSLALAGELLTSAGRPELHEGLLELLGFAQLTRDEVESWLAPVAEAYGRAVAVKHSPSPYAFKLHAHLRPYFVTGAQELIDEGRHREAMWWLLFGYTISNATLQQDGDEDERSHHQTQLGRMLGVLAVETESSRRIRALRARQLADQLFALADDLVARQNLISPRAEQR
jgi:hypothetical protein